jgi:hypothetical protein
VNPDKINCMLMSRYQKAGQMNSIKTANRSFEDVAKFRYFGTTLTDFAFKKYTGTSEFPFRPLRHTCCWKIA